MAKDLPKYVVVIFSDDYGLEDVQGPFETKEKADYYWENCDYSNCIVKRINPPDE